MNAVSSEKRSVISIRWAAVFEIGTIAVASSSAFLMQSPGLERNDAIGEPLACFVTAIIGSVFLWHLRKNTKFTKPRVARVAILAVVMLIASQMTYRYLITIWTERPVESPRPIVTGFTLTSDAASTAVSYGWSIDSLLSDQKRSLLVEASYQTRIVWQDGYMIRWAVLVSFYTAILVLVAICILCSVELSVKSR